MAMTRSQALEILGISSVPSPEELKKVYRRLASKYHPDKYPEAEKSAMEAKFKRVKEAFEFLESGKPDAEQRSSRSRHDPWSEFYKSQSHWFDEEMMRHAHRSKPSWWTTNYESTITVTLKEAFEGCKKSVFISVLNTTETVEIDPGLVPGTVIRSVMGKNSDGEDITVRIKLNIELPPKTNVVWAEEVWLYGGAKEGSGNVTRLLDVSWLTIMTGGFVEVETIDGSRVSVRVPAGIEAGSLLRIANRGYWSDAKKSRRGDLLLRVMPVIPKVEDVPMHEVAEFIRIVSERLGQKD